LPAATQWGKKVLLLLPTLALAAVVALASPPRAMATSCLVQEADNYTDGSLGAGTEIYVTLAYINSSYWFQYDNPWEGRRYTGAGNLSYYYFGSAGESHTYGTSGNAYRETSLTNDGTGGEPIWDVKETRLC
jgi:hypothetical protein